MTALAPPFAVATLVLCVAGLAKLRTPAGAVDALRELRLPARAGLVRALGALEVVIGITALVHPARTVAAGVAALYGAFCVISVLLARRRLGCGCFGEGAAPASGVQSSISGIFALIALAAATAWPLPHGISSAFDSSAVTAGTLLVGIAGAAYATVIAYTELPSAWAAWSER